MTRPAFRVVFIFIVLVQAAAWLSSCETADPPPEGFERVRKVIDGDTFIMDDTEKGTHVRLIGIDAPESRKTKYEDVQPFGAEAKEFATNLVEGKNVKLVYDVEPKDKYGRTLAYVYLEDGRMVNAIMLSEGLARLNTVPPNVAHVDEFKELQTKARESHKGMWSGFKGNQQPY